MLPLFSFASERKVFSHELCQGIFKIKMNLAERSYILSVLTLLVMPPVVHTYEVALLMNPPHWMYVICDGYPSACLAYVTYF